MRLSQQEDNRPLSDVREPRMSGARLVTSAEAVEAVRVGISMWRVRREADHGGSPARSESLPGPLAIVVQGSALHTNLGCFDGILRCELACDLKRDSSHLPVTSCVRCDERYT